MKKRLILAVLRRATVVMAVFVIGSFGGIEQGFLSWGRGLTQASVFLGLAVLTGTAEAYFERR